jgi:hypothetical protein
MKTFTQGNPFDKLFWIEQVDDAGNVIGVETISGVTAKLYEVKTNKVIHTFDDQEGNTPPVDLGNGVFRFYSEEATAKCPVGVPVWFDIKVDSHKTIYRSEFGKALKSPLSDELSS